MHAGLLVAPMRWSALKSVQYASAVTVGLRLTTIPHFDEMPQDPKAGKVRGER